MTTQPKRLIEVALPVKEISSESVRDKSIRHGHISTLHLWWARRPLITLVIIKRLKDGSMRSIISTDRNLSTSDILKIYSYRWDIEVGYLYLKDRLGIGHYQMRKLEAIKKYCALVFAAYCLLEILRITDNQKNIGKSRKIFTIMKKRTYADTVIELSKKGVPKQEIYKRLKLTA